MAVSSKGGVTTVYSDKAERSGKAVVACTVPGQYKAEQGSGAKVAQ